MAWSDAARAAAAMARRLRSKRMLAEKGQPPGQKQAIKRDRQKYFGLLRNSTSPEAAVQAMGYHRLAAKGTLTKSRQAQSALRHRQRMDEAYEYSIRHGLNAGKKRGGFFT